MTDEIRAGSVMQSASYYGPCGIMGQAQCGRFVNCLSSVVASGLFNGCYIAAPTGIQGLCRW